MSLEGEEALISENNPSSINAMKYSAGRWTEEEHNRFLEAIYKFGKDWKRVQEYIETRNSSQIRSHAQKYFNKILKNNEEFKSASNSPKDSFAHKDSQLMEESENKNQRMSDSDFNIKLKRELLLNTENNKKIYKDELNTNEVNDPFIPATEETHAIMMDNEYYAEEDVTEGNFLNYKLPEMNYGFEEIFN